MIDTWLPKLWPTAIQESARKFRQGHLLEWDSVAFGAAFANAVCNVTERSGAAGTGYVRVDEAMDYALITSQTCDICEEGKKIPRMPWISVVPAYDILPLLSKGQDGLVRGNRVGYLIPLTHSRFIGQGNLWVADLRLEFPLEKSVLVGRTPIEGFASEEEYAFLADKLAFRRNRPAIDSRVRTYITGPLRQALMAGDFTSDAIVEIRMLCAPTWEKVERVQIHFIVANSKDVERVTREFEVWEPAILSALPRDLSLLPAKIIPYDDYAYAASRKTTYVDYSDLSA